MYNASSSVYNLQLQARCIVAQEGQRERHRFLAGTLSRKKDNELHVIEFQEEQHELYGSAVYGMPGEIWALAASPQDPAIAACSIHTTNGFQNGVFRLPREGGGGGASGESGDNYGAGLNSGVEADAEVVALYSEATRKQESILFHPHRDDATPTPEILFLDDSQARVCDFGDGALQEKSSFAVSEAEDACCASWDPHGAEAIAVASGPGVAQWDLRTGQKSQEIARAHDFGVTALDFNPNRPHFLVTAGEDRFMKFWDFRKADSPMMAVTNHTHWIASVKYNPFHDQLIATTGTDHRVNLWRITSISSQPLVELDGDEDGSDSADVKVMTFEDHEDSVYGLAWSAYTAWIFASVSFDGRIILHHVNEAEKYKILL